MTTLPLVEPATAGRPTARHRANCPRSRARGRRPAAIAVLAAGISLLGTGAFASWQSSAATSSAALRAASASLGVVDATTGGQMALPVANLLPGDWLYRYVEVSNSGTVAAGVTQTVTAPGTLGSGLLVSAFACSQAWDTTTATCPGSTTSLGSGPLTAPVALSSSAVAPGGVQHVRYRVDMSPTAPTSLMGASTVVTISAVSDLVGNRDRTSG